MEQSALGDLKALGITPKAVINVAKYEKYLAVTPKPVLLVADFKRQNIPQVVKKDICGMNSYGELGRGAFGIVYEVEYNGNRAALKTIMPTPGSMHYEFISISEICVPVQLKSRYITECISFITPKDCPTLNTFALIQPLAISNLTDYLFGDVNRLFTFDDLLLIMGDCIHSVFDMHKFNLMHLDLKPENFLVFNEQDRIRVKASDFGTCRFIEKETSVDSVGRHYTPTYEAPEGFIHTTWSLMSDIYSLGMTLLNILEQPMAYEAFKRNPKSRQMPRLFFSYADEAIKIGIRDPPNNREALYVQRVRPKIEESIRKTRAFWSSTKDASIVLQIIDDVIVPCLEIEPVKRLDIREVTKRFFVMSRRYPDASEFTYNEIAKVDRYFWTGVKPLSTNMTGDDSATANTFFLFKENLIRFSAIVKEKYTTESEALYASYIVVCFGVAAGFTSLAGFIPAANTPETNYLLDRCSEYMNMLSIILRETDGHVYYKSMLTLSQDAHGATKALGLIDNIHAYVEDKKGKLKGLPKPISFADVSDMLWVIYR